MTKKLTALILTLTICFALCSCVSIKQDETTTPVETTTEQLVTVEPVYDYTTTEPDITAETGKTEVYTTAPSASVTQQVITTAAPVVTQSPTTVQSYASYSKGQILEVYKAALTKTRAYTGNLSVHHKESFTGNVVEANPGGELGKQLANLIIGKLATPSEEDFSFSGGKAVNSDGETIPILLPQRTDFSLTEAGIASATISEENGSLKIHIQLVKEDVDFSGVPQYNAASIGYLDTAKLGFNKIKVTDCTISYTGSTIDAVIRPDGYIGSCSYAINLSTTGHVSYMGISGGGTITGAQTEDWVLNW